MTDTQLCLLAKTLSKVSAKIWDNSHQTGQFPGIPENEFTVKIPLKNNAFIKHKVRRLNNRLHQRCRE